MRMRLQEMKARHGAEKISLRNMTELAESFLRNDDLDSAYRVIDDVKTSDVEFWNEVRSIFERYSPAPEFCPVCAALLPWLLKVGAGVRWILPPCEACERAKVLATMAAKRPEIARKRGVPSRFVKASLQDFPAKFRRSGAEKGICATGPRGVGKTHFLGACFNAEAERIEPVRVDLDPGVGASFEEPGLDAYPLFVSAPELLLRIRATFGGRGEESEQEILDEVSRVPVLFIDDLGAEAPSAWSTQALYMVIDRRYGENVKTFISSNYELRELAGRLDDRITSRIAELCEVVKMAGPDRRVQRAGRK